jgi:hypothetical protein
MGELQPQDAAVGAHSPAGIGVPNTLGARRRKALFACSLYGGQCAGPSGHRLLVTGTPTRTVRHLGASMHTAIPTHDPIGDRLRAALAEINSRPEFADALATYHQVNAQVAAVMKPPFVPQWRNDHGN